MLNHSLSLFLDFTHMEPIVLRGMENATGTSDLLATFDTGQRNLSAQPQDSINSMLESLQEDQRTAGRQVDHAMSNAHDAFLSLVDSKIELEDAQRRHRFSEASNEREEERLDVARKRLRRIDKKVTSIRKVFNKAIDHSDFDDLEDEMDGQPPQGLRSDSLTEVELHEGRLIEAQFDEYDGLWRCSQCNWEIEQDGGSLIGYCTNDHLFDLSRIPPFMALSTLSDSQNGSDNELQLDNEDYETDDDGTEASEESEPGDLTIFERHRSSLSSRMGLETSPIGLSDSSSDREVATISSDSIDDTVEDMEEVGSSTAWRPCAIALQSRLQRRRSIWSLFNTDNEQDEVRMPEA